ncbi:hypothetical protein T261_00099 [Streptomyces lydicus]|nr:hypothetical protein T261_00099 [Streptomyces lydicus]
MGGGPTAAAGAGLAARPGGQPEAYCHRATLDAIRYPGRDAQPTAGVIDSQSVKANAVVGSNSCGFDGGSWSTGVSDTS